MLKFSRRWKSRWRKVVNDSSPASPAVSADTMRKSGWENLPAELLREICKIVEETENRWPRRGNVVAFAGVCTSWREAMKDVVFTPEVSGRLTFPISLQQPGPRNSFIQCFIKWKLSTQTYYLYLNLSPALADDGKFLLAARRSSMSGDYNISLYTNDILKGKGGLVGKLRSHLDGTNFDIYEAKMVKSRSVRLPEHNQISPRVPCGKYPVAQVSYDINMQTPRGYRASDNYPGEKPLTLRTKAPIWDEEFQCWYLDFHGRVTVDSLENFQLVALPRSGGNGPEPEKTILQFGKVGKDAFTMDYSYPLSAFHAFAICLSNLHVNGSVRSRT